MVKKLGSYQEDIHNASSLDLPWQKLKGKNILITGASGLIGSCIVEILMARNEINFNIYVSGRNKEKLLNRFYRYNSYECFHIIEYDVTTQLDCNIDFHYIISAASGASPTLYSTNPTSIIKANIYGTDNLLSYGMRHNNERFVYISSGDIYGEGDGRIFTEEYSGYVDILDIRSCYTSSKRAAETLCISYAHQYNMDVCIARPCHIYGPCYTDSDTRVYAQFFRNAINNENIVMKSDGHQLRSWCYVVDAAVAILFILLKGECSKAYNIADDNSNLTIREFAEIVAKICNKKVVFENPSLTEIQGFNRVNKSLFSTKLIKGLGWSISNSISENLHKTLNELMN